jgi:hypothetical protein
MSVKYSKWPKIINILQTKALKTFTQIVIFGLKINHLATLVGPIDRFETDPKLSRG